MALKLPNDKVVYNLPEQVGVNTENIAYLAEVYKNIDEIPAQWAAWKEDADETMGDYATTMGDYALTMGGYQTTMQGYANTMGGYQTTMEGWALQVDTWTNNISVAAATAITGQDITPKTVSQTQANWSASFNLSVPTGLTVEQIYNRFEVINNVFYIIVNFKVSNTSGSDIVVQKFQTSKYLASADFYNVPSNIGSAIYDLLGNTVAGTTTDFTIITLEKCKVLNGTGLTTTSESDAIMRLYNRASANTISVKIGNEADRTVPNGAVYYITGRIALTLL